MKTRTALSSRAPALTFLFARYVAGQIADTSWDQFMYLMDAEGATPQERTALAAFLADAVGEIGSDAVKLPKPEEVQSLLTETRSA